MANQSPCLLFKETRVNLDWPEAQPLINIILPRHAGKGSFGSPRTIEYGKVEDVEETFKYYNHAKAGSVYHRPASRYPRCILWRIIHDWRVLSITSTDFTKPEQQGETGASFQFHFPETIKPSSVGFADSPHRDELIVYILLETGILYTLSLTTDMLMGKSFTVWPAKDSEYCKTYSPSAFALHAPHFLHAIDHESLIMPLRDGNLLKLTRQKHLEESGDTVARYIEKTFSDSSYLGLVKNRLPWVGSTTIPYGRSSVYQNTAISAVSYSPSREDRNSKGSLLFTVSVDHALKVWSIEQETSILVTDLLNETRSTSSKMKTLLDPSPSHLLAIIDTSLQEDHLFYLATFSSATTGRFKFWAAVHSNGNFVNLIDLYPHNEFEAKPPTDSAPWIISEFRITPGSAIDPSIFNLWVLWKSDTNFRVQNIQINLKDVPLTWELWTTATSDSINELPSRAPSTVSSEDVTDYWMDWIFYPGRFTDAVLQAALKIYERNFSTSIDPKVAPVNETVQASAARIVASSVELQNQEVGEMVNYKLYRNDVEMQWERFGRLCTELDKQRGEALSLTADPITGFIWTVNVDGITALRECTESEVIRHNYLTYADNTEILSRRTPLRLGAGLRSKELEDIMLLVGAGQNLQNSLSETAYDMCIGKLQEEVTTNTMFSVADCMWSLYETCLMEEIPDGIAEKIEGAFDAMDDPQTAFKALMSSLFHSDAQVGSTRLTGFGAKVLIAGCQEIIKNNHELLFGLVLVLVWVNDTRSFFSSSEAEDIYSQLLNYYKEYEILTWLAANALPLPDPQAPADDLTKGLKHLSVSGGITEVPINRKGPVLQLILPRNFGPPPLGPGRSSSITLSLCIRQFLARLDLGNDGYSITKIARDLISHDAAGLALDFSKFIPSTSWGTYVKGRIQMKNNNHVIAACAFKRASYNLAITKTSSPVEAFVGATIEKNYVLGGGLSRYNLHIASLFEEARAPLYVVEFSKAALPALEESSDPSLHSEVLLKLFQSALHVSLFDDAYLALSQYIDKVLQRAAVRELIRAMVEQDHGEKLCSYPFIGLQDVVDDALAYMCSSILDVSVGPPFHKVLYAWRIQRGNYRGAASVLYERLQRLQTANVGAADPNSRIVTDGFLALINVMQCVGDDQAWILSSKRIEKGEGTVDGNTKRKKLANGVVSSPQRKQVITLSDIKSEYRNEIERLGLLLNGGFFV